MTALLRIDMMYINFLKIRIRDFKYKYVKFFSGEQMYIPLWCFTVKHDWWLVKIYLTI